MSKYKSRTRAFVFISIFAIICISVFGVIGYFGHQYLNIEKQVKQKEIAKSTLMDWMRYTNEKNIKDSKGSLYIRKGNRAIAVNYDCKVVWQKTSDEFYIVGKCDLLPSAERKKLAY